jgi:hypothetical protein
MTAYEHLGLRLPEIGRVKLGQKGEEKTSKQGKKYQQPEKLDHFRIVRLGRGSDNNFEIDTKAHDIYGAKPKCLQVRPISGRLEENIQAGFNLYSQAGIRLCFGDGQIGNQVDANTGEVTTKTCPCAEYDENRCKKYAKTSFFLDKVGGLGGVHTMTIRGRITVPALVGSLKFLSGICDDAGKSIAGVGLDLRLNEVMTKYGKVYSPYFIFPGTREELLDASANVTSSKFRVLADEDEEADDTEDPTDYQPGEESFSVKSDPEAGAQYESKPKGQVAEKPKSKKADKPAGEEKGVAAGEGVSGDVKAESVKVEDAKAEAVKVENVKAENVKVETAKVEDAKAEEKGVAAGEVKPVRAFWCDACKAIVCDREQPAVCKCGKNEWHESINKAAAESEIVKAAMAKAESEKATAKELTFWCDGCHGIVESATSPGDCVCGKNHWHGAGSVEAAKKAVEVFSGSATAPAATQTEEAKARDAKIGAIGAGIKRIFGSSSQGAILKQISILLDRTIEGSQYLADCELDELTELLDAIKDMPKNDRDGFIEAWKQGRKERGDA